VALLGSYDPHTKTSTLSKDKAAHYLKNGAQPSDRVIKLFQSEKISLPKWVNKPIKQKKATRNPEKLRKNQPAKPAAEAEKPSVGENEKAPAEAEQPKTETTEKAGDNQPAAEPAKPAEDSPAQTSEEVSAGKEEKA
jgi:small subunit ribosomal protein S16